MANISRQHVFDQIKAHGLDKVKNWVSGYNQTVAPLWDKHIKDYEDSLVSKRQETREEESLSISRKALLVSKYAMISAIVATVIAATAIILNIINTP